eukprot:TRINITY_DN1238_c0_g2_i1.p1 TRINITY_DN1238_c0_g2~~TRINITY_DN1238_c0_g2_i1.p1  ORF type:complete len:229 (+),score=20.83 TRINITY_DN1238_c0_g2_i1:327-1013(+)
MAAERQSSLSITTYYLVLYNALQSLGWMLVLFTLIKCAVKNEDPYSATSSDVGILQMAALLEVVHAATGIVRTGVVTALMQWAGRAHVLFCIAGNVLEVQRLPSLVAMFGAWALSEVIRYPQYTLSLLGIRPNWLTYLRYTAFIVLYPIGVFAGEMFLIYSALPYVRQRKLYGDFFRNILHAPFDYSNFLTALLLAYPFLWLHLYLHMLRQRRAKIGKGGKSKKAKSA